MTPPRPSPRVHVTLEPLARARDGYPRVLVRPASFLGDGLFKSFRDALSRFFAHYDPAIRANRLKPEFAKAAAEGLALEGFDVVMTAEVEQACDDAILEVRAAEAKDGVSRIPLPMARRCKCDRGPKIPLAEYEKAGDVDKALGVVHGAFMISATLTRSQLVAWKDREALIRKMKKGTLCRRCIEGGVGVIFDEGRKAGVKMVEVVVEVAPTVVTPAMEASLSEAVAAAGSAIAGARVLTEDDDDVPF